MYIEVVTLTNFQCFGPEPTTITLESGVTALIGSNGTGKTAACQALLRLFGVTTDERTVRPSDFYVGPSVTATADAGDAGDAGDAQSVPDAEPDERNLSIEVLLAFPELDDEDGKTDAVPEFFQRMAADDTGTLKCRIRLESRWVANGTVDGAIETDYWAIPTLEDDYADSVRVRFPPTERGRIQMLYVPASRDGARHVATFLRGRLWRAARWSEELREKIATSAAQVREAFHSEKATVAIEAALATRWSQLHGAGTHATPHLEPLGTDINALLRGAELKFEPDHTSTQRTADQLSDGQRSLLHLALTAATLDLEKELTSSSADSFDVASLRLPVLTLLAVEEPENNLSPFYLSRIVGQLLELGDGERAQTLLSSHSPSVLTRIDPRSVRFFRRGIRTSTVCPITLPDDAADAGIDEFTREAMATEARRSFTADDTTILLDKIIAETGRRPENLRMDNGPELTAAAMRDWCRFGGTHTAFIEPGSPWQNGYCESFNGRFRDELLSSEQFDTLLEAQVLAEDWRIEYNTYRPHGSLGGLTPADYHHKWTNQPALS